MSHLPLDARAILHYLNELGYRNISATQLKEFLKDLRKLIKYEERMGVNAQQNDYYDSLFRRTTASYRAKIDKENDNRRRSYKRKSVNSEPLSTKQSSSGEGRKVLRERNHGGTTSSSDDVLNGFNTSKSDMEKSMQEPKIDTKTLKLLIEKTLAQVLHDKYSQEFVEKDHNNKSAIRSIVEQALEEKLDNLNHVSKEKSIVFEPGSLRSNVEEIVTQVLKDKLSTVQKPRAESGNGKMMNNLNQDMQQKLIISKEQNMTMPREKVFHYNPHKPLDSESLVKQLLASDEVDTKNDQKRNLKKAKANKENSAVPLLKKSIKRSPRSPRKKPEWKDPTLHDKELNKAKNHPICSQSPVLSPNGYSGRSKGSSSVLIRRSKSQGRKPNSDPVALYQYYKNEWEHFRKQIPGETPHSRLRWHVRQRLLDSE